MLFKKSYITITFLIIGSLLIIGILTSSQKDPKNPPIGQTGAPNETTCSTATGCHKGGTYSGTVELTGLPNVIVPNTTYPLTITLKSSCIKTGFEMTVLDKANTKCGELIAGIASNIKTANYRQYIRQTTAMNLANNSASYTFSWKSPASIVGDTAIFYYSMLQANGNGGTSGDNVANAKLLVPMTVQSNTINETLAIKVFPSPAKDYVNIITNSTENINAKLINNSGSISASFYIVGQKTLDVSQMSSGVYYLEFQLKNEKITKRLVIAH